MTLTRLLIALLLLLPIALPSAAQNQFAPVAKVNDRVVTQYELSQRIAFLTLLRAPGVTQEATLDALINERLQLDAGAAMGIRLSDEQVQVGMEEFAARANLSTEEFIKAIGQGGVSGEAFRDFVRAGLVWREVVRGRFGPRAQVTEAEIDRALAQASSASGIRVLLSEIILPAAPPQAAAAQRRAADLSKITTIDAFSAAARRYSASGSRGRGGRLDWMPLSNLPPQIRSQVLGLSPGQVSAPIAIPNGIVLFQMRAIEEVEAPEEEIVAVEYAAFYIPGGRSDAALREAEKIRAEVDTCDDLYGVAKGLPEERLQVDALPVEEVPQDVAIELAKLDEGEVSTALTRADGETLVFLMMCGRTRALIEDVSREDMRGRLVNQRLASYADSYLAQLRADATITKFTP